MGRTLPSQVAMPNLEEQVSPQCSFMARTSVPNPRFLALASALISLHDTQ